MRFARRRGILCQGRGSAANSTVCYVLGITAVDPSKHDLLFERFVSASRGEPPDIDVDFEHERREEVIQHIYDRYGCDRAAIVGTVIRFRGRSAIREGGKALGLSQDVTGRIAKAGWGPGRDRSLAEIAEAEGFNLSDRRLALTLQLAEEIQDFPRHLATHVGGFVMSRGLLTEMAVVGNAAMEGRTVLEWDKDDIDALGLLKVDILALGMLSCLRRGFDLLRRYRRLDLDLAGVPRDCGETYAMLRRTDSLGVFQVESRAQMNMLPRLRPSTFYDLVVQVALVRPGPIQGDMVHLWACFASPPHETGSKAQSKVSNQGLTELRFHKAGIKSAAGRRPHSKRPAELAGRLTPGITICKSRLWLNLLRKPTCSIPQCGA